MAADSIPVRDEEIKMAVVVEVSEAAPGGGADVGDHRPPRNLIEGAVAIIDEEQIGSVVKSMGNKEIQVGVVVDVPPGGSLGIAVVVDDRTSGDPGEVLSSKLCGRQEKAQENQH